MLCQFCLQAWATRQIIEPGPFGRAEPAHYCDRCYEAKYVKPPAVVAEFPRPRFKLKHIMILVTVFAVPNVLVAWVMRSGWISGTPAQLRQWTATAFVVVNASFGTLIILGYLYDWLQKVSWHKRTGGIVGMPTRVKMTSRDIVRLIVFELLLLAWFVAIISLTNWLFRTFSSLRPYRNLLFTLLGLGPVVVIMATRSSNARLIFQRVRHEWKGASTTERFWRWAMVAWLAIILFVPVFQPWILHRIMNAGGNVWVSLPIVLFIGLVIQFVIMAGVAMSTRRR